MDVLKQALYYASKNMAIIPLYTSINGKCSCGYDNCKSPGKHPRTANGLKSATKDAKQIKEWWTKWPEANIGIVTGAISGIIAVDVDCGHKTGGSGAESLANWETEHGILPKTWTSLTGGGGNHYIFECTDSSLKNKAGILPGVDIRANGGYIVAPPSLHISGKRYEWEPFSSPEDIPLIPLPDALLEFIKGERPESYKPF